jgi:hypothetical protein
MKVWIVSECYFEGDIIKYICLSKEHAIKRWDEVRCKMVKDDRHMVDHCKENEYHDISDWENRVKLLQNLKPGEVPECSGFCDYPGFEEWECEE